MPVQIDIKVHGVAELDRALKELGPRVARRVGDRALRAAVRPIVLAARQKAPRATGHLRRSIRARAPRRARGDDERMIPFGSSARHAHLVEFGTGPRYHKSGKYVGKMPARSFLRAAIDEQSWVGYQRMIEVLSEGIERETAELSRKK